MKTLIVFLLLASTVSAQDDKIQAVEQDITELYGFKKETDKKLETIKLNLQKCHQEYKGGVILNLVGLVAVVGAIPLYESAPGAAIGLTSLGGVSILTGTIKTINSHKYIKRAVEY